MDKLEELRPCPFPHEVKRGVFVERDPDDFFFVRVSCGDCGCAGPYVPLDSKDGLAEEADAVELWNNRPEAADEITRLNAEVERARADALEEAAQLAETHFSDPGWNPHMRTAAESVAFAIRALILKARGKDANVG